MGSSPPEVMPASAEPDEPEPPRDPKEEQQQAEAEWRRRLDELPEPEPMDWKAALKQQVLLYGVGFVAMIICYHWGKYQQDDYLASAIANRSAIDGREL